MTKKVLFSLLLTLMAFTASAAGPISFGAKAGAVSQNVKFKDKFDGDYMLMADSHVGWQMGLTARFNLIFIDVQPEILYNNNKYRLYTTYQGATTGADVRVHTVDVPIMFAAKMLVFRLQAGPRFNLMTDTNVKRLSGSSVNDVKMVRPSVGYSLGAGVDILGINFDVRYNGNGKKVSQDIRIGDNYLSPKKSTANDWTFSLGYMF